MSTEFLFNRGALRRARTAWDEKRERNGEKAAKLSAELRELCICASPALQNLAANAGVVVEQLKLNRTPIYGLRRYRGVGHKRQIGPESLQWRDLDIDWESHSGKAFQETICNEWLALIRRLDVFLKANNLVGGLDTAAVTDAVLACRAVTRDSHAAEIFRLLEGMRFESSEWEQMMSHLEDYLAKSQCALCSAVIGREGHLCGDCTAIVETLEGFLMLWDIAPVEVCSDFSSWIELKDSACQLFGYQLFTHTTLNELELWLAQRCQEGEPVDFNMKTIVELVRRAIAMNSNAQTGEIGPNHDRFTGKRFESDRKSTRLNSSHGKLSRMPSSA